MLPPVVFEQPYVFNNKLVREVHRKLKDDKKIYIYLLSKNIITKPALKKSTESLLQPLQLSVRCDALHIDFTLICHLWGSAWVLQLFPAIIL